MAVDFPSTPTEGQTFTAPTTGVTYTFTNGAWYSQPGAAGGGSYLPLAGGTLTGDLNIAKNGPTLTLNKSAANQSVLILGQTNFLNRWALNLGISGTESGSNVGSDFEVRRYSDAGAYLDSPLTIARSSGVTTLLNRLVVNGATPVVALSKAAAGQQAAVIGYVGNFPRWTVALGDGTAEGGSNAGSDFVITRAGDTGSAIDNPLTINRASGTTSFANGRISIGLDAAGTDAVAIKGLTANPANTSHDYLRIYARNVSAAGANILLFGPNFPAKPHGAMIQTGATGNMTWEFEATGVTRVPNQIVTGGPDGLVMKTPGAWGAAWGISVLTANPSHSDMFLQAVNDTAGPSGMLYWAFNVFSQGFQFRHDGYGVSPAGWLPTSDGRLKRDVRPIRDALEKIGLLVGTTYRRIDLLDLDGKELGRRAGVIAQDVRGVLPEASVIIGETPEKYQDGDASKLLGVDPMALIALLIEGMKELHAEVNALKTGGT